MKIYFRLFLCIVAILFHSLAIASTNSAVDLTPDRQPVRFISVSGSAEKRVPPNLAHLNLTIEHRNLELELARKQVTSAATAVLASLRALKIADADINAGSILVAPAYTYDRSGERRFEGYTVTRPIRVSLRDIALLGSVIERGLNAGANQISEPIFDHSEREEIERSVLGAATQAARENAIAAAAGVDMEPGAALQITVANSAPSPRGPSLRVASMDASSTAESSYQPGNLVFRVNVDAQFELKTRP
jgi:uncharacterized protein YggE